MNIPPMTFKLAQEVGWAFVVAAGLALFLALVQFDPEVITDWRAWGLGLLGQVIRGGATAVVAKYKPG